MENRMYNARNPYQGEFKRVLCVCSAGLLRSPTAALVLSQPPFEFNTRCVGLEESFALIPMDPVLLEWADEIVVMSNAHEITLRRIWEVKKPIVNLNIPDSFGYRDKKLMRMIKERYLAMSISSSESRKIQRA